MVPMGHGGCDEEQLVSELAAKVNQEQELYT